MQIKPLSNESLKGYLKDVDKNLDEYESKIKSKRVGVKAEVPSIATPKKKDESAGDLMHFLWISI